MEETLGQVCQVFGPVNCRNWDTPVVGLMVPSVRTLHREKAVNCDRRLRTRGVLTCRQLLRLCLRPSVAVGAGNSSKRATTEGPASPRCCPTILSCGSDLFSPSSSFALRRSRT